LAVRRYTMNIMAVFAHPDDEVLGAGGTIARYAEAGHHVNVFFATSGRCIDDEFTEALAALGVHDLTLNCHFTDQMLDNIALLDITRWLEALTELEDYKLDLLITHYLHDLNLDHQITARAAMTAFRDCPRVLMTRPIPYALEGHPFEPNFWVRLHADHVWAAKRALACYKSEMREYPHWRSPAAFDRRFYELPNNLAAEPFRVVRWVDELPNQSVLPSDRK